MTDENDKTTEQMDILKCHIELLHTEIEYMTQYMSSLHEHIVNIQPPPNDSYVHLEPFAGSIWTVTPPFSLYDSDITVLVFCDNDAGETEQIIPIIKVNGSNMELHFDRARRGRAVIFLADHRQLQEPVSFSQPLVYYAPAVNLDIVEEEKRTFKIEDAVDKDTLDAYDKSMKALN